MLLLQVVERKLQLQSRSLSRAWRAWHWRGGNTYLTVPIVLLEREVERKPCVLRAPLDA